MPPHMPAPEALHHQRSIGGAIRGLPFAAVTCGQAGLLGLSPSGDDFGLQKSAATCPARCFRSKCSTAPRGDCRCAAQASRTPEAMAAPSPQRIAPIGDCRLFVYLAATIHLYTAAEFVCDAGVSALDASVLAADPRALPAIPPGINIR